MSKSTHVVAVKGNDQTGAAFSSVESRAAAASAKIRSALGGALSAVGAYLSLRAVASGVNELGRLSDVAQKTSTSVDELTRAASAMGVLGINANVDGLAKAFQMMEKNTGRSGLQGFYDTIGELGKIPDVSDRAAQAMKVFGRSGMEFMPLINAAKDGTNALEGVINAMPKIPQAAADAGDDAADAMAIVGMSIRSIWLQALGKVIRLFAGNDEDSLRGAAAKAAAWMEYFAKVAATAWQSAWRRIKGYTQAVGDYVAAFGGALYGGGSFADAAEMAAQAWGAATREMCDDIESIEKPLDDLGKNLAEKLDAIDQFEINYRKAAESTGARARELKLSGTAEDISAAQRAPAIRNELIMGGSNAALRTAMLGPQMQTESKKQTALLEKIAKNTEKTADNTDDIGGEQFTELN